MDFRILGPFEVVSSGKDLTPARPKQRALLAALLLRPNEVVRTDALLEILWGETQPDTAHSALHGHVSALRKLLGSNAIETRSPGYLLRVSRDEIDLGRFEALVREARGEGDAARKSELLRSALALFRGEPLADFRDEPFAREEKARIEERRLSVLEDRFDAGLDLGGHAELVAEIESMVSAHPLRERLRAQLMLALYRAGRQADALRVYREGRRVLADELGLEPGPALKELEHKILIQDTVLVQPTVVTEKAQGSDLVERTRIRRLPAVATVAVLALVAVAAAVLAALELRDGGTAETITGDALGFIDLERGALIGSVPLGSRPGAVAIGEGGVWVTLPDRGTVVEIDPDTRAVVDTIPVGADPSGIAVGAGSVWVTNSGSSTVSRISPATHAVVQTIAVPAGPAGITVGRDGVWLTNSINDSVSRIDPIRGRVAATIAVGDQPVELAVVERGLWVANAASGTATRVDARHGFVAQTVDVGNGPGTVAAGSRAVWVVNGLDGTASRIDPTTNAVVQTIAVGETPIDLVLGGDFVWVSDASQGSVTRIDWRSGDRKTIPVASHAGKLAVGDGLLWVSVRGPEAAHRGGTLTISSSSVLDTLDPALAYFSDSWNILALTNDGLVGFKRVGGLEGATLVPDLARSLPRATDGGRKYTFQLRPGLRYSDGRRVRPDDFRRALERVFRLRSDGAFHYAAVEGAAGCERQPERCDLSRGIVADRAANAVTFNLVRPDPDFLYRLALPFAFAVPAGTAAHSAVASTVPATGPYRITRYVKDKELVLRRNRAFRQWSAARPGGFPDRIVWQLHVDDRRQVSEILESRADLMFREPPPVLLRQLAASYAGQLHVAPRGGSYFMSLNTTSAPFDDVRVRRALNFAVDRKVLAEIFAGEGQSTCQVLPPNFPGYVPYCPFTRHPDRTWTAPDLAAARDLVRASRTARAKVTVWATPDYAFGIPVPVGRYFVRLLRGLGYRALLRVVESRKQYFAAVLDPARHVQMAFSGWASDYPAESGFIVPVLSCAARESSGSQFCDRALERRMDEARRAQTTDLASAHRRWSSIEHAITDRAPWVPLVSRSWVNVVSERLGNFQVSPQWGPLVDQMWVQ